MQRRLAIIGCVLALAGSASATDLDVKMRSLVAPSYYFNLFGGTSLIVLGSEDKRTGIGVGFGYGRPEPKFRWRDTPAQLVWEVYYDHSSAPAFRNDPPNQTESFGLLAYGKWRWPPNKKGVGYYMTAGWGLQYSNRTTRDLDSKINSTPMIGIGVAWDTGNGEASLGLRFLHISNAGLVGNNKGQNQLHVVYSWRF